MSWPGPYLAHVVTDSDFLQGDSEDEISWQEGLSEIDGFFPSHAATPEQEEQSIATAPTEQDSWKYLANDQNEDPPMRGAPGINASGSDGTLQLISELQLAASTARDDEQPGRAPQSSLHKTTVRQSAKPGGGVAAPTQADLIDTPPLLATPTSTCQFLLASAGKSSLMDEMRDEDEASANAPSTPEPATSTRPVFGCEPAYRADSDDPLRVQTNSNLPRAVKCEIRPFTAEALDQRVVKVDAVVPMKRTRSGKHIHSPEPPKGNVEDTAVDAMMVKKEDGMEDYSTLSDLDEVGKRLATPESPPGDDSTLSELEEVDGRLIALPNLPASRLSPNGDHNNQAPGPRPPPKKAKTSKGRKRGTLDRELMGLGAPYALSPAASSSKIRRSPHKARTTRRAATIERLAKSRLPSPRRTRAQRQVDTAAH